MKRNFFFKIHKVLVFLPTTGETNPGNMYSFFVIASLMGGRAPDQGPMNIARLIHL